MNGGTLREIRGDVTETELAVLKALWEREAATIRELADELYPGGSTSHYATVQKLLERLQGKGFVGRRQAGRANVYRAAVEREELIARRLQATAETLCEGSMTPLLTQLVGSAELSREDVAALRRLVERLDLENGEAPTTEGE